MNLPRLDTRLFLSRVPITLMVLGACILWASWSVLVDMQARWAFDPTYSHGYLVPLASLVLLWARRDRMPSAPPAMWALVTQLMSASARPSVTMPR